MGKRAHVSLSAHVLVQADIQAQSGTSDDRNRFRDMPRNDSGGKYGIYENQNRLFTKVCLGPCHGLCSSEGVYRVWEVINMCMREVL